MAIIHHTLFRPASGTSQDVPNPPIKVLLSCAFGSEFIKPPGLAIDSGVGDTSSFRTFTMSTGRPALTALSTIIAELQQLLICLDKFLYILLGGSSCLIQISKSFRTIFLQFIMKSNGFLSQLLMYNLLFPRSCAVNRSLTTSLDAVSLVAREMRGMPPISVSSSA